MNSIALEMSPEPKGFQIGPFFRSGYKEPQNEKSIDFTPDGSVKRGPGVETSKRVVTALLVRLLEVAEKRRFAFEIDGMKHGFL